VQRTVGRVSAPALSEVSGLAASRRHPGLLWMANDSGDRARVYAVARGGRLERTVEVRGAAAVDWEDLALGPGPRRGRDYLYAADIGDNEARRGEVVVYRFPEPAPGARSVRASALRLRYPDGAHNAEALLVDPRTGRLVVVTKRLGDAGVYAAPGGRTTGGTIRLRRVGSVSGLLGPITGGAVSPDGRVVALRTVLGVALWRRPPRGVLWSAFGSRPCLARVVGGGQGEAVTFAAGGSSLLLVPEGERPPIAELRGRGR
jgi:hypothetical protein